MRLVRYTIILYIVLAIGVIKNLAHAADAQVFQREYIYTTASEFKQIQTSGLNTCVGLVLYQKSSKKAVLAHIDASVDPLHSVDELISLFETTSSLEAWVYGGIEDSSVKSYQKVILALDKNRVPIVDKRQNRASSESMNLRFNLRRGEAFINNNNYVEVDYRVRAGKVSRLKFGKKLYRHEKSLGGGDDPLQFAPKDNFDTGFPGGPIW